MMATLLRIGWTNLRRDRVAQALTFVLPIVFFSIFANVFAGQADGQTARIRVAAVDEDRSELSARLLEGLRKEAGLRVRTTADEKGDGPTLDRAAAERLVHEGDVPVAIVLPRGLGQSFARSGFAAGNGPQIQLLADVSDRIAPQVVLGLLQKVTMTAAPDLMMQSGLHQFEQYAGPMTPQQKAAVDSWMPRLKADGGTGHGPVAAGVGVGVQVVDVMRTDSRHGSLVSFYAAGIGVMFLLFSSVSGAGGALLDEAEAGTLERLLSTNIGMTGLLAGKWLFLSLVGFTQLTVKYLWGRIAFGLPLFSHLPGFAVMTVITASSAAALGLVLATLARTRAQLSGFSTILILTMSALGGSMFPRFLMSDRMQRVGLMTFNAWALDGYLKVFWRNAPLWQLWPQVLVLCALTAVFLAMARLLARRWESA
jgi:ABC-2 type transport system permease protein